MSPEQGHGPERPLGIRTRLPSCPSDGPSEKRVGSRVVIQDRRWTAGAKALEADVYTLAKRAAETAQQFVDRVELRLTDQLMRIEREVDLLFVEEPARETHP